MAVIVGACVIPTAWGEPRPSLKLKKPSPAPTVQAKEVKTQPPRECEAWPPKPPPLIVDLYQLKLEYDCRHLAIAHHWHAMGRQEAKQSVALAEARDLDGLARKDEVYGQEQAVIANHQRALEQWRDKSLREIQAAGPTMRQTSRQAMR